MKRLLISLIIVIVYIPFCSYATTDTIYAKYKYVMGYNDTKNDAQKICFLGAKKRCIEKAGAYIKSQTEISNYQLSKYEMRSYTGAIIKVEAVDEKVKFEGKNIAVHMVVKADVDTDIIKRKFDRIRADIGLQNKIKKQQKQLDAMERRIILLQKGLSAADHDKSIKLRKKRKEAFDKIDALSPIKLVVRQKAKLTIDNIELGMTKSEVIGLIGGPRATDGYGRVTHMNYGERWIIIENSVVNCIVSAKAYSSDNSCRFYRKHRSGYVIK